MVSPEELGGVGEATLGKGEPDHRAADHHAVDTNGRNLAGEEIFFTAELAEEVDVSPALVSKGPALADADAGEGIRGGAEMFHEILGLQSGEVLVEGQHQRVGEAHSLHEPQFVRRRREQAWHGVRAQNRRRVGVEGQRHGGGGEFLGFALGGFQNHPVAEVHPVENPGGDHHRAGDFHQTLDGLEDAHHAPRSRETAGRLRTRWRIASRGPFLSSSTVTVPSAEKRPDLVRRRDFK